MAVGGLPLEFILEEMNMNRCRRCGNILENKSDLWCDYCRKRVDEEINHETSRPLERYFSYYYKNR